MHIYYVAGLPYSDDLYHSGTKGMKWGRRLYQYEDGTLTPLGKIHYAAIRGAKATGKAVGKATKKVVKYEVEKFKRNHPWMMSNEELDATLAKAKKIEAISAARETARGRTFAGKLSNVGWGFAGKLAGTLGDNLGKKLGEGYAQQILEGPDKRETKRIQAEIELENAKKGRNRARLENQKENDEINRERREYNDSERERRREEKAKASSSRDSSKKKPSKTKASSSGDSGKKKSASTSSSTQKGKAHVSAGTGVKGGKTSASKAGSSAQASEGKKWTKKSSVLEADWVYDSYDDYVRSKTRAML